MFDELTPKFKPILIGLFVAVAAFFGGWSLGNNFGVSEATPPAGLEQTSAGAPAGVDFSIFWQTWQIIDDKFVNGTTTGEQDSAELQKRVYGATTGLVQSLGDPYTVFLPPENKKTFAEDIRGYFGGVGMELGARDKQLLVISTLKNTPAEQAGIRAGDVIVQVDSKDVGQMTVEEVIEMIRGEVGTKVILTINRPETGTTQNFEIIRAKIQMPTSDTELLPNGVFVIRLYSFNALSRQMFKQGLREFLEAKTDKLIIDLRGNPGGYLEEAVQIASFFLPEGKVIVKERHRDPADDQLYRSHGYNIFNDKLKLVILIDGGSASASEILAGALSEYGKATLVGETTFGKGSVQELVSLPDDSAIKITIAKWLTPNDHSISEKGLEPDIKVAITDEDRAADRDPQLDAAINYLLNKK